MPRASRAATITLMVMVASQILNFFDRSVVSLASAEIMNAFHLSPAEYGLLASAFYSFYAISGILVGLFISHRMRPRLLLATLVAFWLVAQVPVLFVPSFALLILCRAVLGIAESPGSSTAVAVVHEWYDASRRNLPTALVLTGPAIGAMVAPPVLTKVITDFGWQAGFLCCALLSGIVLALILLLSKDGPDRANPVSTGMIADPTAAPWFKPVVIATIAVGFCGYWVTAFAITWLFPLLHLGLGFSQPTASWIMSLTYVVNIIVTLGCSALSQWALRRGASLLHAVVWPLAVCLLVTGLLLGGAGTIHHDWAIVVILMIGTSLVSPVAAAVPILVSAVAPLAQRNRMLVVIMSLTSIAGLVAPAMTGWLVNRYALSGYSYALMLCGALALAGALVAMTGLRPDTAMRNPSDNGADPAG